MKYILPVPYFVQPTETTCQATSCKMLAVYYDATKNFLSEEDIKKLINEHPDRPVKEYENHIDNMVWWLNRELVGKKIFVRESLNIEYAIPKIISCLNPRRPVLLSTNHSRVEGHIIVVVGYQNYHVSIFSPEFKFIINDPYGKFHASLGSKLHGKKRFQGGMSLLKGGSEGPGRNLSLDEYQIGRTRKDQHSYGVYHMIY